MVYCDMGSKLWGAADCVRGSEAADSCPLAGERVKPNFSQVNCQKSGLIMEDKRLDMTINRLATFRRSDESMAQLPLPTAGETTAVCFSDRHLDITLGVDDVDAIPASSILSTKMLKTIKIQVAGAMSVELKEWFTQLLQPHVLGELTSLDVVLEYERENHDVFEALSDFAKSASAYGRQLVHLTMHVEASLADFMRAFRDRQSDMACVKMCDRSGALLKLLDPSLHQLLCLYNRQSEATDTFTDAEGEQETELNDFDEDSFEIVDGHMERYCHWSDNDEEPSYDAYQVSNWEEM
ncbi:Hypothetical predicted protein [Cloeon dipterum]|uniref:Uncharacterized protein n=1 Tax=Cloeon dipterum TaxID=197152 RepID=A0A8S1CJL3_9INSE|nr:Hypothetical predicted protein [Cloeon dipterum]